MISFDEHTSIQVFMSAGDCYLSHSMRMILAEKNHISYKPVYVDLNGELPEDFIDVSPSGKLPILTDRKLRIEDVQIMSEYLDERFPHPPLMPAEPANRAQMRIFLSHIYNHWGGLIRDIETSPRSRAKANKARASLENECTESTNTLFNGPYAQGNEFSFLDCIIAPILWRLPNWSIDLKDKRTAPIKTYQAQIFESPRFRRSLIEADQDLNKSKKK